MRRRKKGKYTCTKLHALKVHSKNRARVRYGLTLNNDDLRAIVQKIRSGSGTFVKKQTNRVSEWIVSHNGISLRVLYDKMRRMTITCLPPKEA